MGNITFQFGNGNTNSKAGLGARIFMFVFATPFAAFGAFAAWSGVKGMVQGNWPQGLALGLFGLVFLAIGVGLMYAAATAARRQKAADAKWLAQTDGGQKVWLVRQDWSAGKIKSSAGAQWKMMMFMGILFFALGSTAAGFIIRQELAKGEYAAALILIFPLVGLALLIAAIRGFQSARRFGDSYFELAQVPAPLGGSLDGLIQTERPFHTEHGLHLKLSCLSRMVSGSGDNRSVQENVLWQNEKIFRPDAPLPVTSSGGTGIPVHFALPPDQPETVFRGNPTIIWRLDARAKTMGADYSASFELPVFRVAGSPAVTTEADTDPTAPLQMSVEEIRRDENSKIQVNYGPHGREFYFPPARNLGTAVMLTVFWAIWSGVVWLLIVKHAPLLFPIVFGLLDVLVFMGCISLWLKSSRVMVSSTEVTWQNRWLIFGRTHHAAAGDILRFETKSGMTSGQTVYYDVKLVLRSQSDRSSTDSQCADKTRPLQFRLSGSDGFTIASAIPSKPEADWLVQQMNQALGRQT